MMNTEGKQMAPSRGIVDCRIDLRLPVHLNVEVMPPNTTLSGTAIDMSFGGIHIVLNPSKGDFDGAHRLWVCFEPDAVGLMVPAQLVHRCGRHVGLMFGHYDASIDIYLGERLTTALEHMAHRTNRH